MENGGDSDRSPSPGDESVDPQASSRLTRIFEGLSHPHRRAVLYVLEERSSIDERELAREVVRWESDSPEEVSSERVREVHANLVHKHLPKLREYDLVEHDRRSETVRYRAPPAPLSLLLRLSKSFEHGPREP